MSSKIQRMLYRSARRDMQTKHDEFNTLPPGLAARARRLLRLYPFTAQWIGPIVGLWGIDDHNGGAGFVYVNGDGLQVRWSVMCPLCEREAGDGSFGVWQYPGITAADMLPVIIRHMAEHVHKEGCTARMNVAFHVVGAGGNAAQRRLALRKERRALIEAEYVLGAVGRHFDGVSV